MSGVAPTNPKPFLQSLVQDDIIVRLKWSGYEYRGKLISADGYMNLQLDQTEEYINGKPAGQLGQVLIRCNNVLWIKKNDRKGVENGMEE